MSFAMQKIDILRRYERLGYQIAYYLLENEELSICASKKALIELYVNHEFFEQEIAAQKQIVKRVFALQALKQLEIPHSVENEKRSVNF